MKHLRLTFRDTEFEKLKQAKGNNTWHDYVMTLKDYVQVIPPMGVLEIPAVCPKCGYKMRIDSELLK